VNRLGIPARGGGTRLEPDGAPPATSAPARPQMARPTELP